jgi:N-acetylglucosamine-6-phosphate deacetylase
MGIWEKGWLLTEGATISLMSEGDTPAFLQGEAPETIDATGLNLLPGFIDLHAHGAMGIDTMDASAEGLREIARYYARYGVTAFLPTTWTASREATLAALQAIGEAKGTVSQGATIIGAHMEGPYLNAGNCGAQDPAFIRPVEREEALEFLDTGVVRLITIAPEFEENLWLVEECSRRGITVSAGHTSCSYEKMIDAVSLGLRQVTHCFNAMPPLNHRQPGPVGAALSLPQVACEIIADNVHVHPVVVKLLVDVKGPDRVILVTDAVRWAGLQDGAYRMGEREVTVKQGEVRLASGALAGSTLTMNRALQNMVSATGRDLGQTWPMSNLNAARSIGIHDRKGSLEVGKDADLVLLDSDFGVYMTVAEGNIVYRSAAPHPGPGRMQSQA